MVSNTDFMVPCFGLFDFLGKGDKLFLSTVDMNFPSAAFLSAALMGILVVANLAVVMGFFIVH